MSYLWILLLFGGLLAGRVNTQEMEAETEEPADATMALPENEEPLDLQDETVAEERLPESDSQPSEAEPHEEVMPAEGEAQPDSPLEAEVEPEAQAEPEPEIAVEEEPETTVEEPEAAVEEEPEITVEEEPEAIVEEAEASPEEEATSAPELVPEPEPEPEVEVAPVEPTALPEATSEPEPEAEVEPEPETTVEPTSAPETDATTKFEAETDASPHQDPAAFPEDPKSVQEDLDVTAQPTAIVYSSNPHQRHGFNNEGTIGEDSTATLDESPNMDVDAKPESKPKDPSDGASNSGDASSLGKVQEVPAHSGRGKSVGSVAHVAEATGEGNDSEESGSGSLAAILCAVGVAVVGAVAAYFTYQKKKLCFKNLHDDDPEAARKADTTEAQSDPQVLSNLLNSS
ncbi:uncharacterized protein LOC144204477 isoform X2 [Stigmatopora nigra]